MYFAQSREADLQDVWPHFLATSRATRCSKVHPMPARSQQRFQDRDHCSKAALGIDTSTVRGKEVPVLPEPVSVPGPGYPLVVQAGCGAASRCGVAVLAFWHSLSLPLRYRCLRLHPPGKLARQIRRQEFTIPSREPCLGCESRQCRVRACKAYLLG